MFNQMFNRKNLKVILAGTFALALTACAGGSSPSTGGGTAQATAAGGGATAPSAQRATIEIAYWEGSSADQAGWETVLNSFDESHPEIEVIRTTYPSSTFRDQLATRLAANDWPDVIRYQYQGLGRFKEAGVMLDLTDKIDDESLADLIPAFLSAVQHEGRIVAMPHHTDTIALFYNIRMFEESGIRIPQHVYDGWTWEEWTDNARRLKADHNLAYAFGGIWENTIAWRFMPFMYANGGRILSDDLQSIVVNSPENLEVLQMFETWRAEDLIVTTGFTQSQQINTLFAAEQVAFTFSGSWHSSFMEENLPGNWGVTYMPVSPIGITGSDMGGNAVFAHRGTSNPDAAATLIDYLTSAENMRAFCEAANFIPVRQSLIDEGMNYTNFQDEMNLFLEIVATVDPVMASHMTSTRFRELNLVFAQEMDPLAIDGSATAQQVLDRLQTLMTQVLND